MSYEVERCSPNEVKNKVKINFAEKVNDLMTEVLSGLQPLQMHKTWKGIHVHDSFLRVKKLMTNKHKKMNFRIEMFKIKFGLLVWK